VKLSRDVALKVLPEAFTSDPDRLARFKREAQVLASLNHPNIAQIHGIEDLDDVHAIVLELVEGPTLADRIRQGPIPIDEALTIAKQIAEALEAAHDQGVVHRDLKPANIKLRPDGAVKVLDFGLAKTADLAFASTAGATLSPTLTSPAMTAVGIILGTAAYMSPEQARGTGVDRRSDIWSFGCVLHEMLTGEQLFRGETITDVLAAIVNSQPDLGRVPFRARRLLRSCLAKQPSQRLQAISDAWLLVEEDAQPVPSSQQTSRSVLLPVLAAVMVAAVVTTLGMRWRQPVAERLPLQFHLNPPRGAMFNGAAGGFSAISPDGRSIVFSAMSDGLRRLWVRHLESLTPHELAETSGAYSPFWSPDGHSIAFFADGKLKTVDSSGGTPVVLTEAPQARGGTWGPDGTILFALSTGPLRRIPASGGTAIPLGSLDRANGEYTQRWPQFLPDARRFLFYIRSTKTNRTGIYISSLDRPREKDLVLSNATAGAYAAPHGNSHGHLLWVRDHQLIAQPFEPTSARLSGEPTPIVETEGVGTSGNVGGGSFSVSDEGTLLFTNDDNDRFALEWYGRDGRLLTSVGRADRYVALRISPNGSRVATSLIESFNRDLWTMDFSHGLPSRLTNNGGFVGVWSPDGQRIAYHNANQTKLFTIAADGGDPQMMFESDEAEAVYINDWSPDGRFLLCTRTSLTTLNDLWVVPVAGDRKPVALLVTPFNESHGQYSPDGKWIAYTSDDSGQQEIYVRRVEAPERTRVSSGGGSFARWRADGKELFFRSLDGKLMAVPVSQGARSLDFGTPTTLMDIIEPLGTFANPYDVAPDGQRILTLKPAGSERPVVLTVLINWDAGLKK
jgi:serine/threonine protein kinase